PVLVSLELRGHDMMSWSDAQLGRSIQRSVRIRNRAALNRHAHVQELNPWLVRSNGDASRAHRERLQIAADLRPLLGIDIRNVTQIATVRIDGLAISLEAHG